MQPQFDQKWQRRLADGEADAALQLTDALLQPLYEHCHLRLGDQDASQCATKKLLLSAVAQIGDFDASRHGKDPLAWVLSLATNGLLLSDRHGSASREKPQSPGSTFSIEVETDVCLEARERAAQRRPQENGLYATRQSSVAVACPSCGAQSQISPTRIGSSTRCGRCGETFVTETDDEFPSASDDDWYLKEDGRISGPYTPEWLREKIANGLMFSPTAMVRRGEAGEWHPAADASLFPMPPATDDSQPPKKVSVIEGAPPREAELVKRPKARRQNLPTENIARFQLREPLGSGSFADVYLAFDPVLERDVALKVATQAALGDELQRTYVLDEPKAAARLRHPNIVAVYDAGFDGEQFFIAMEFVRGCTLRQRLAGGKLPHDETVPLVRSLAEALDYAHHLHSGCILHRDVKPENIMCDAQGQALLMDFGLARIEHAQRPGKKEGFLGTPGYMAPEQIRRDASDKSDQYSLGIVLYELLCGRTPFEGPVAALVWHTQNTEPPRPRTLDESIPADLEAICLKAIAKDPHERYASCGELAGDLRRYCERLPTLARPLPLQERLQRWCQREPVLSATLGICAALALLFLVTLAASALMMKQSNQQLAMTNVQLEEEQSKLKTALDELEEALAERQAALDREKHERRKAQRAQAIVAFHLGNTKCNNGEIPQGVVQLVEALRLLEEAKADNSADPYIDMVRLAIAAWSQHLHPLESILVHDGAEAPHTLQQVVVAPRGTHAVTISQSSIGRGAVWLWDLQTSPPTRLQGPVFRRQPIHAVAFSSSGVCNFATLEGGAAGPQTRLGLWRIASGKLESFTHDIGAAASLVFSPDGARILTINPAASDNAVTEWLIERGEGDDLGLARQASHVRYRTALPVRCAAYSPDGKYVAIGMTRPETGMSRIAVYLSNGGTLFGSPIWEFSFEGRLHDLEFSHDSELLAMAMGSSSTATGKGEARLWKAATGDPVGGRLAHLGDVYSVQFSDDNRFVLTGGQDRGARLWDRRSGRQLGHPLWHIGEVRDVAFLPDQRRGPGRMISVCGDGTARVWHLAVGSPLEGERTSPGILAGANLPGGRIAVVGAMSVVAGKTQLFDPARTSVHMTEVDAFLHESRATAIAAGAKFGIVGLENGQLVLIDWNTGEATPLKTNAAGAPHTAAVLSVAMNRESSPMIVSGGADGRVLLWRLAAAIGALEFPPGANKSKIYAVAFDPNTDHVLAAGADGTIQFWNRTTRKHVGHLRCPDAILSLAFSDSGDELVAGFAGGAQVWRRDPQGSSQWKAGARIEAETGIYRLLVCSAADDPTQQIVATGDLHGNIRFWHLATGEPIGPPLPNQGMITMLLHEQSAGPPAVLSGTINGSIRRWQLPQSCNQRHAILADWARSITGMRMGQDERVERIAAADWQPAPLGAPPLAEHRRQGRFLPRVVRLPGETPQEELRALETLQSQHLERPSFAPPTLAVLDRYLPADTQAVIGLDVRQVSAAPVVLDALTSYATWLPAAAEWQQWIEETGFRPFFDIHYVLLAMPSGAFNVHEPAQFHATTLVVQGQIDLVQLQSWVDDPAHNWLRAEHRRDGNWLLTLGDGLGFAAIIGDHTLVAAVDKSEIMRVLDSAKTNRLNFDFRKYIGGIDRSQSFWLAARGAVIDASKLPPMPSADKPEPPKSRSLFGALLSALFKGVDVARTKQELLASLKDVDSIEAGITTFSQIDFHIQARFRSEAATSLYFNVGQSFQKSMLTMLVKQLTGVQMPASFWDSADVQVTREGAAVTVEGHALPQAIQSLLEGF